MDTTKKWTTKEWDELKEQLNNCTKYTKISRLCYRTTRRQEGQRTQRPETNQSYIGVRTPRNHQQTKGTPGQSWRESELKCQQGKTKKAE